VRKSRFAASKIFLISRRARGRLSRKKRCKLTPQVTRRGKQTNFDHGTWGGVGRPGGKGVFERANGLADKKNSDENVSKNDSHSRGENGTRTGKREANKNNTIWREMAFTTFAELSGNLEHVMAARGKSKVSPRRVEAQPRHGSQKRKKD